MRGSRILRRVAVVGGLMLLAACVRSAPAEVSQGPVESTKNLPAMRWDHRPEAASWTRASLRALDGPASALPRLIPADIDAYCPAYRHASLTDRKAFWAGLFSALAKHESTWNPGAVGGGGRVYGLVQIMPATARRYGCLARQRSALKDGAQNLACGLRIAATTVARDGVISRGGRGVAADWTPFRFRAKRNDIAAWTSTQSYCSA
ncbi:MAG: transglycosylase SLT domain-containing protein [Halocynthiibacter sp.]